MRAPARPRRSPSTALGPQPLIRFGEGITATILFLVCGSWASVSCDEGQPIDTTILVLGVLALPSYALVEYVSNDRPQGARADEIVVAAH